MKQNKNLKAFSLVELALVLVIVGILLSVGIVAFKVLIQQAKFKQTRDTVNTACETIKGYAERNYLLPTSSSFLTLGIPTKDAYNQDLVYIPASALNSENICTTTSSSLLTVNIYNTCSSSSPTTKNNVAFIVYSKGENRLDQTDTGSSTFEIWPGNCNVSGKIYDDIACFYDLDTLRAKICPAPLTLDVSDLPTTAFEDSYYEGTIKGNGGFPPYNISTSSLPCGLQLSGNKIYGTLNCNTSSSDGSLPTCSSTATFTITITDSPTVPPSNSVSTTFNLTVKPKQLSILEDTLPDAYEGVPYSATVHAVGGSPSYSFSATGLPSGLTISSDGTISGTPSTGTAGTYSVSVKVEDSCGTTFTKIIPLIVNASSSGGGGGGGGGSGSCSSYTLRIKYEGVSGTYVSYKSPAINGGNCNNLIEGSSRTHTGLSASDTLEVRARNWCWAALLLSGDMQTLDTNGDCNVKVSCKSRRIGFFFIRYECSNN